MLLCKQLLLLCYVNIQVQLRNARRSFSKNTATRLFLTASPKIDILYIHTNYFQLQARSFKFPKFLILTPEFVLKVSIRSSRFVLLSSYQGRHVGCQDALSLHIKRVKFWLKSAKVWLNSLTTILPGSSTTSLIS